MPRRGRRRYLDPDGEVRGGIVLDDLVHSGDIPVTIGLFVDPDRWGICGGSSGGDCAFTAAWLRPDRFRRVIGFCRASPRCPAETLTRH